MWSSVDYLAVNPKGGLFLAAGHKLPAVAGLPPTLIIALPNNVALVSSTQNFRMAKFLEAHIL